MSDRELNNIPPCILNLNRGYTQNSSVKIVKGSLAGCEGRISGCSDGVYFVRIDDDRTQIGLFVPNEFELLN